MCSKPMPFVSKRQARWAYANKKRFARRWSKMTDFARLPEHKDTLAGSGGLLGVPGMGSARRWGNRRKDKADRFIKEADVRGFVGRKVKELMAAQPSMSEDDATEVVMRLVYAPMMTGTVKTRKWGNPQRDKSCTCGVNVATKEQIAPGITRIRGNLCNVHGRYGPCDAGAAAKKPKKAPGKGRAGRKPAKPKLTPEQRAADRDKLHAENRSKVLASLGIAPDGQAALEALRSGAQADPDAIARGGFVKAGLVEQAADGSYRLTASGRATLNAAAQGDQGRAGDTISGARDRTGARETRQTAAADKKRAADEKRKQTAAERAKKQPSAGGSKRSTPDTSAARETERQQQRATRESERQADRKQRQGEHEADRARSQAEHEQDRAARDSTRQQQLALPPSQRQSRTPRVSSRRPAVQAPKRRGGNAVARTKAQTPSERAMFAKMGGGGSGGGGGKGGGGSKLWPKGPSGKRTPQAAAAQSGGGDKAKPDTHLPQSLAEMSRKQHIATVDTLSKLPLSELRRRQDLTRQQQTRAHEEYTRSGRSERLDRAVSNLDIMEQHLRAAIDKQVFGDKKKPKTKSFTVFKSHDGAYRWIARSTTAYRDRDGEIITTKALEQDAERMTATNQYGPLRYWHIGQPDPFNVAAPWGAGVDIGDCDYSTVIGRTSIESGTFKNAAIGKAFADSADEYELSPGFFHPPSQPDTAGEYHDIRRFERSVVPTKYGRASNLFTGMTVKEHHMDQQTYEQRVKAFMADMRAKNVPPEVAAASLAGMEQADKSAGEQGITFKSDDAPIIYSTPGGLQGIIKDGCFVTLKAAVAPAALAEEIEEKAEDTFPVAEDDKADESIVDETDVVAEEPAGDYLGDMTPDEFFARMRDELAPVLKMQDMHKAVSDGMAELKSLMGGVTTKEAGVQSELATLKARVAELEGSKPAVVTPDDVEAALKGAPQSPPDPTAPQVPNDPARPFAAVAARTFPQLYSQAPDGTFSGWQAPPQS